MYVSATLYAAILNIVWFVSSQYKDDMHAGELMCESSLVLL